MWARDMRADMGHSDHSDHHEHPVSGTHGFAAQPAERRPDLAVLRDLRRQVDALGGCGARHGTVALGIAEIDRHLPWGGLPRGCLHEILGDRADGAPLAFAVHLLALLSARHAGPVLWLSARGGLYPPGLHAFGPASAGAWTARLLAVRAHIPERPTFEQRGAGHRNLIWALEEALRTRGPAAVAAEVGQFDLVAARRLQLAAEEGGALALVLREAAKDGTAQARATAVTRWHVRSAPSASCAWGGPGAVRWRIELLRCRGGAPRGWMVERDDETGAFAVVGALRNGPRRAHATALAG